MSNPVETDLNGSLEALSVEELCRQLNALLDPFTLGTTQDTFPWTSMLSQKLGPRGQGYLALAQLNVTAGDLAGNSQQVMRAIQLAEAMEVDAIVFPEMVLMGYPVGDIIQRHPFIVDENLKWLTAIAKRTGKTRALVGFVEPRYRTNRTKRGKQAPGKPFYNSLAILGEGKIEGIVRKCLLPNYGEFYDARTFEASLYSGVLPAEWLGHDSALENSSSSQGQPLTIHGHTYGISICEDIWNDTDFFSQPLYARDPIAELAQNHPDVLINASASPTRSRKEQMKHNMLSHVAQKYEIPVVYINQVGAIDELSFDGASRVYNASGQLTARAHSFQSQLMIVNPVKPFIGTIYPLPLGLEKTLTAQKVFNAHETSDLGRTYETLVQGIRNYFKKSGFQRALLGLSGGLDSAVTVTLLVDALGADSVVGVSMPSKLTSEESREDARLLADNLGISLVEVPITHVVEAFNLGLKAHGGGLEKILEPTWGPLNEQSFARDNVQAISRATVLRQLGNNYHALPIATSDKSEYYLGYATVNGDMSGAISPLGDVPKTKVRALAHWLNEHSPVPNRIPARTISKPSGAELAINPETGEALTAESALMPYEFADEIIWRIEALQQSKTEILAASFQWEVEHSLSLEQKKIWVDRFFRRMAASVFKWWIAPPVILVEGNGSITKTDYRHPITANQIQWEGMGDSDRNALLDAIGYQVTPTG